MKDENFQLVNSFQFSYLVSDPLRERFKDSVERVVGLSNRLKIENESRKLRRCQLVAKVGEKLIRSAVSHCISTRKINKL